MDKEKVNRMRERRFWCEAKMIGDQENRLMNYKD